MEQESESTIALTEESRPTIPLTIEEAENERNQPERKPILPTDSMLKYRGKIVTVAGASPKVGTTFQAIQICLYLQQCGYRVAYVEGKQIPDICNIIRKFSQGMLVEDSELGFIRYDQLPIYYHFHKIHQVLQKEYDYFVLDLGCYGREDFPREWFQRSDYKITVCGITAQQYEDTKRVFQSTSNISNCSYIFSRISEENQQFVREFVQERIVSTTFAIKVTNPFQYSPLANSTYQPIFHLLDDQDMIVIKKKKASKGKWAGILIASCLILVCLATGLGYVNKIKKSGNSRLTTLGESSTVQPQASPAQKTAIILIETGRPEVSSTPESITPSVTPRITATPTLEPQRTVEPTAVAETSEPTIWPELLIPPEPTEYPEPTILPEPTEHPEPTKYPDPVVVPDPTMQPEQKETPKPSVKPTSKPTAKPTTVAVKKISLPSAVRMLEGGTLTLDVICEPANATNQKFSWTSSNTKVLTVKNGKIKAIKKGKATVTVKSGNGKTASCTVVVSDQ